MDILSSRTSKISQLAMDGLVERQRAIGANIANCETPGYLRKEVAFESQLSEIIEKEDLKNYIKCQNSIEPKVTGYDEFMQMQEVHGQKRPLTPQEKRFLITNSYGQYDPQVMDDVFSEGTLDGNNVELEKEMVDLTKNGTKFLMLSNLQSKYYSGLKQIISENL
jgi:flagellar basal body rod protein FlgB